MPGLFKYWIKMKKGKFIPEIKYNIVPMEMVRLTDRMGTEPFLSVKRSVSIDTIVNFDGGGDGHRDGDGTCKQAFSLLKQAH